MSLDDFLNSDKFLKLTEGGYDNINSTSADTADSSSRVHGTNDGGSLNVIDVT